LRNVTSKSLSYLPRIKYGAGSFSKGDVNTPKGSEKEGKKK
jgi:hypothetical protein